MRQIYLDTAAATPLEPRVARAMRPFWRQEFANPASLHEAGVAAARALEAARARVAQELFCQPDEAVFTGGGTEGNNLAILGVAKLFPTPQHLITSAIEHASVLAPLRALERAGWQVTVLPVSAEGLVEPPCLAAALRPETVLVSLGYVNNEIGVIQPLAELARVIRKFRKEKLKNQSNKFQKNSKTQDSKKIELGNLDFEFDVKTPFLHSDACQAPRFLPVAVNKLGVDLLTLNGGKIYGPKGVGALYVKRGIPLAPLFYGGGQEGGRRSGTENVPAVVGLAAALELAGRRREADNAKLFPLRDYFIERLQALGGITLNGSPTTRVANNVNVSVAGVEAEQLVIELAARGIACSTGSACSIPNHDERHVILALGHSQTGEALGHAAAESALRFTLDRLSTRRDLHYVLKETARVVKKLRAQLSL